MKMELKGRTIGFTVDERTGYFRAALDGDEYEEETLARLREKLMLAMRAGAAAIDIPFTEVDRIRGVIRAGTATGLHATHRTILVRWADGGHGRRLTYDSHHMLTPLSGGEHAELDALLGALLAAERAFRKFENDHRLDLAQAVRNALGAATA